MSAFTSATTWNPVELTVRSDEPLANPIGGRTLTATFEHESGTTHEIAGFPDGEAIWRVRFAPTRPGRWEWRTTSDPSDDGLERAGSFVAARDDSDEPLRRHGFLRAEDRRLIHDDGTPFFWLADTVWSAGAKARPDEWERYLRTRTAQGFSVVQLNSLPQHDASRPHGRLPFGGDWDLGRPDPDYFQALDELVARTHAAGLVPALVALWFDYVPGTNADWNAGIPRKPFTAERARRFGRYLGARYGSYGAVWLVAGDSDLPEEALEVYEAAARGIRETVTHPLCTLHTPGGYELPASAGALEWVDFHCYQSGHHTDAQSAAYELAEHTRSLEPTKPALNGEPAYERHVYFDADERRITRAAARRAAWWSVLAGATAGVTYGGHGLWQWHRDGEHFDGVDAVGMPHAWETALEYDGATDYAFLRSFLERYDTGSLEPRQELHGHGDTVRAAHLPDDDVLLVYTPERREVRVEASTVLDGDGDDDVDWLDPETRRRVSAPIEDTEPLVVAPPPWEGDALLVCTA